MSRAGHVPYAWADLEPGLREAIRIQHDILLTFGPAGAEDAYMKEDIDGEIDLEAYELTRIVRVAYFYAYQLNGCEHADDDLATKVSTLLEGFPRMATDGNVSPFAVDSSPLRRILETYQARWRLHTEDWDLTIRQLALLSDMTIPAARTSLSKEGFRLEKPQEGAHEDDTSYRLNAADARLWLSRRRGYIPNRDSLGVDARKAMAAQLLADGARDFPAVLAQFLVIAAQAPEGLARKHDIDAAWLKGLLRGEAVAPDLAALRATARALGVPEPEFVGAAVTHLLAREVASGEEGETSGFRPP